MNAEEYNIPELPEGCRPSLLDLPVFNPKQKYFYETTGTEILWAGDTRAGKSAGVKLSLIKWCYTIPGLECDVWRLREEDVIAGYMRGEFGFPTLLSTWIGDGLVTTNETEIKFWNGSYIKLNHCFTDVALSKVQGIPKHVRVIDEAGQIPERRLKMLKLWMTMSHEAKNRIPIEWRDNFPKIIYLMNRMGPSKNYFRSRFVRARPKYQIEKVGAFRQVYIPADLRDNPCEDIEATIERVNEAADPAMAKALLSEGGWDAQTGNYFEGWDSDTHIVRDFVIPDFWVRFRTFDYGSYEPWACLWWAISPGVELGETYIPRGCLVCYREWYGCKAEHPKTEGDKTITNRAPEGWSNTDMAHGIIDRTEERFDSQPTFTDRFPFIKLGGRSIAKEFEEAGLILTLGELDRKNRGSMMISKLAGEKLIAGSEERWPMMVFFESCKYCQDYIPMVERHPDEGKLWDYVEDGEPTHIVDCCTLAAVAHKVIQDAPTTTEETINKALKDPRNTRRTVRDIAPDIQW